MTIALFVLALISGTSEKKTVELIGENCYAYAVIIQDGPNVGKADLVLDPEGRPLKWTGSVEPGIIIPELMKDDGIIRKGERLGPEKKSRTSDPNKSCIGRIIIESEDPNRIGGIIISTDAMGRQIIWDESATVEVSDSTGIVATLNQIRAGYGLSPVTYDPNAARVAEINNAHQAAYGLGHHYTGGYAQNSAMGSDIWGMWMASPAHRALILDPSLISAGGSSSGGYSTLNASGHYAGVVGMVASHGTKTYQTGVVAGRPQFRVFSGFFARRR